MGQKQAGWTRARGFLSTLARDTRANTLAMMAMALIPLAGMVGGGIDISRMYIVKTRLQHACDAGALAGRKAMGSGAWTQTVNGVPNYPREMAEKFFVGNYDSSAYGATGVTKSFAENAGKVTGTASATVPMTLMRIFGKTSETLSVTCDAEMRLPNTDVMFVLDTTGSMNDVPSGDNKTKMAGLKIAVKCFYQILSRLDIADTDCEGPEPSGGTGGQIQIRFGFVPYATNVNVGRLLKPEWIADNWTYQSRVLTGTSDWGSWTRNYNYYCGNVPANTATVQYRTQNSSGCYVESRTFGPVWKYAPISHDISGLKNGTEWNSGITLPIGNGGTNKTVAWDGCIEERATVKTTNFASLPANAYDLNIDLVPTNDTTRWGAALPGLIYTRQSTGGGTGSWNRRYPIEVADNYTNTSNYYCPTAAKKMQTWPDAGPFATYVNSLTPSGNTYHDIGLIWGARLLSPTGLFASENARTPSGSEIERHLIFMTDGDTNTQNSDYNAYGIPWFDRRQTDSTNKDDLDQQVDLRFAALCTAIKNREPNITLWVISFGSVSTETENRLKTCADTGRYFAAGNSAALQTTFKNIADQISQLRLTQ